jgi:prepilin-type processing-associated H-X9-DG protein
LRSLDPAGDSYATQANVAFGDGRVEFVAEYIDLDLWRNLGNRADGNWVRLPALSP